MPNRDRPRDTKPPWAELMDPLAGHHEKRVEAMCKVNLKCYANLCKTSVLYVRVVHELTPKCVRIVEGLTYHAEDALGTLSLPAPPKAPGE